MSKKIPKALVTILGNDVAPRFDLTTEVLVSSAAVNKKAEKNRAIVLARESEEDLCRLILDEEIEVVICGGIEQDILDYLKWKNVRVLDSVMGSWKRALKRFRERKLVSGAMLFDRPPKRRCHER